MGNPWKKRAFEYNKRLAEKQESAADMHAVAKAIAQLPAGQVKKILSDDVFAILSKYGVNV